MLRCPSSKLKFLVLSCFLCGANAFSDNVSLSLSLSAFSHQALSFDPTTLGGKERSYESVSGFVPELGFTLSFSPQAMMEIGTLYAFRFSWLPENEAISVKGEGDLLNAGTTSAHKTERHDMTGYVRMELGQGTAGFLVRGGIVRSELLATRNQPRVNAFLLPWITWHWTAGHESHVFLFNRREWDASAPENSVESSVPHWFNVSGGMAHQWSVNAHTTLGAAYVQESLLANDPWFDHTKRGAILRLGIHPFSEVYLEGRFEGARRIFELPWKRMGSCQSGSNVRSAYYANDPLNCSRNETETFYQVQAHWDPKPPLRFSLRYFVAETKVADLKEFDTSTTWIEASLVWQMGGKTSLPSILEFLPYDRRQFDRQGF
ncbi:MAG: hypothetical protein HYW48_02700 [Deltaproteobacteria bacterium]|nr:hypothetical protein [Deltaproteobacteria bacterium]